MAFIVPLVAAAGSAIASAGAAIGGLLGAGTAATAATGAATAAATAAPAAAGIFGTGLTGWQALSLGGSLFSGVAQYGAAQPLPSLPRAAPSAQREQYSALLRASQT
jgi:hypothetical protein